VNNRTQELKADLVVQDVAACHALLNRVDAIERLRQGLADVKAGRTKPARQVFAAATQARHTRLRHAGTSAEARRTGSSGAVAQIETRTPTRRPLRMAGSHTV
jgi:hypothetical protein